MDKRNTPRILMTLSLLSLNLFTIGPTAALQSKSGVMPESQDKP